MGNESSTLLTRMVIYEQMKKKLFKKSKLKMDQSCQISSEHFMCKPENIVDDNDDSNNEQWIDPADFITSSYEIETFYCDEHYLDKIDNNEYENNNKTQNYEFKLNKFGVQNNSNDTKPIHHLNDNNDKDTDKHEEIIDDNHLQPINNDLNNNLTADYFKLPEYPTLFQSKSSSNNIQHNTTLNNEQKTYDQFTTNIHNSIISSLSNSNDNSARIIRISDLYNNYSYSNFTYLIDNVQYHVNSLKHDVSIQCDMCCKHTNECESYENNVEKCSNVTSSGGKSTCINYEKNNYDKLIKLSQKIPVLSTQCNEIMDYMKQKTIACSKVNHGSEEYLVQNDSQSSQIYIQMKLQPNSYNDHFELNKVQHISDDTEINQNDQMNHMNLTDTSLQNVNHENDEYDIISMNNELISRLEEPISVDVIGERYIHGPSITEEPCFITKESKISKLVNSRRSLKECIPITNYMSDERSSTEDSELKVGEEIRDSNNANVEGCKLNIQNTSMIIDNNLLGQPNTIQTIGKHTNNFKKPTYIQIVDSLHHN
ncbi:hypothetical protein MN116_007754 [Schistosoma mekongi]|uniref:Uncharacterized protein n=1 Tax=Schistosoma mekongi TaxID=38744 RepID=A0AAE1Z842_SCHME|nr:hypothetical protein MN116_007754 [Schistosoma mekongi]